MKLDSSVSAVVTGGAGFVPSHLVDRLLADGLRVVALDNFVTGHARNIAHLENHPNFEFIEHDVSEPFDVAGPVDFVFHMASPASPIDYVQIPVETLKAGSYASHNALDLALKKKATYLVASTSEVYGDPRQNPQDERYWGNVNPVGPRSVYDEAKRFGEALTTAHAEAHGTDTCIVRLFNTYGPRMRGHDGRAVPTFVRQALAGEPLTVTGDGRQTRSLCYVDDTVAGILAAGNRAMIKPSEFTENVSGLMARLVPDYFDESEMAVFTGDAEVGIAFSKLAFDHLIFTGATSVVIAHIAIAMPALARG